MEGGKEGGGAYLGCRDGLSISLGPGGSTLRPPAACGGTRARNGDSTASPGSEREVRNFKFILNIDFKLKFCTVLL